MNRREFGKNLSCGVIGAGGANSVNLGSVSALAAHVPRKNTLMHVGGDYHNVAGADITAKENLEYNLRHGVKHLTARVKKLSDDGAWDPDNLRRMKGYWERITYFLENIIPVAREYDVRMACHPYDPPGLPFGYQGADNWDSPSVFDGIKRYESIIDTNGIQYNGIGSA